MTAGEYNSSILSAAVERVIECYPQGQKKQAEYLLEGEVVGIRWFHETGEPSGEIALRGGVRHGMTYRWDLPGLLLSATPYVDGLEHGTAKQWADDGTFIGGYTMDHGTGLDLWWAECGAPLHLAEARFLKDGERHGFEWWINADQTSVHQEQHLWEGQLHGIERQWNSSGRLRRGFPRYYVHDRRVTKAQYRRACLADLTLPPIREEDNMPARRFPAEVAKHLRPG